MPPKDLLTMSEVFGDPDPEIVAKKINKLTSEEKKYLATLCFEMTGKIMDTTLDTSIGVTFKNIFKATGRLFFGRIPSVNLKFSSDPKKWKSKTNELRKLKLFADTSDFDLLSIVDAIEEKELIANESFITQYEEVTGVYILNEPVNVFEHNNKIANVTREGIFGDDACITGELDSSVTVRPIKDCKAYYIPREKFTRLIRSVPGLQEKIFQDVVERARLGSVRAQEQRRLIKEILDNIGQGSFSIDRTGEIGENYTAIAADYLNVQNLAGVPFADIAFRNDRKTLRNYYRALHMLFSGSQSDHALVLDLLPKEVTINKRIFKLYYSFLQDGTGSVVSVFVRMEDLTLERELAKKEEQEKNILAKMQQNIGGFMDMLANAENSFKLIEEFADKYWDLGKQPEEEYFNEIMRTLHGSKGLCGQFELNKLKATIHSLEDWFLSIEKDGIESDSDRFAELFQQFDLDNQYALSFKESLGEGIIKILDGISFSKEEFAKLKNAVENEDLFTARSLILSTNNISAERIVSNWRKDTGRLAEKLGKKVEFQLEIEKGLSVSKELAKTLNVDLGHLYRNCVDHGIELPEIRKKAGKDESGILSVKIFTEHNNLVLTIADDGAGLNKNKVAQIARTKSNLDQYLIEKYINNEEHWKILFLAGFSSVSNVTDVSGRGVGMDAVQTTVSKLKGSIVMDSTEGKGTVFSLKIPLDN